MSRVTMTEVEIGVEVSFETGGDLLALNELLDSIPSSNGSVDDGYVEYILDKDAAQTLGHGAVTGGHGLAWLDCGSTAANFNNNSTRASKSVFLYDNDRPLKLSGLSEPIKVSCSCSSYQQLEQTRLLGNVRSYVVDSGSISNDSDIVFVSNETATTPVPSSLMKNSAPSIVVSALVARYVELTTEKSEMSDGAVKNLALESVVPSVTLTINGTDQPVRAWTGTVQLSATGDGYTFRSPMTVSAPLPGQGTSSPPVLQYTMSKATIESCCLACARSVGILQPGAVSCRCSAQEIHKTLSMVVASQLGEHVSDASVASQHVNSSAAMAISLQWALNKVETERQMGAGFEKAIKSIATHMSRGVSVTFPNNTEKIIIPSVSIGGLSIPIGAAVNNDITTLPLETDSAHEETLTRVIEDAARVDPYLDELGIDAETVQPLFIEGVNQYRRAIETHWQESTRSSTVLEAMRSAPGGDKFPFGYERVVAPVMAAIINNNNVAYRYSHDYQMFVKASGKVTQGETELMNNPIGVQTWESAANIAPSGDCEDRSMATQLLLSWAANRVVDGELEARPLPPLGKDISTLTEAVAWVAQYAMVSCVTLCSVYGAQLSDQDKAKNLGLHAVPTIWWNAEEFRSMVAVSTRAGMHRKLADGVAAQPHLTPGGWPTECLSLEHAKCEVFMRGLPRLGAKPAEGTGAFVVMPFEVDDNLAKRLANRVPPTGPLREAMGQTTPPMHINAAMAFAGRYTPMAAAGPAMGLDEIRNNTGNPIATSRFYAQPLELYAPPLVSGPDDRSRPSLLASVAEQVRRGVKDKLDVQPGAGVSVAQFPFHYTAALLREEGSDVPTLEMHPDFGVFAHAQSGHLVNRQAALIPQGAATWKERGRIEALRRMSAVPCKAMEDRGSDPISNELESLLAESELITVSPEDVATLYVVRDYPYNALVTTTERPFRLLEEEIRIINEEASTRFANSETVLGQRILNGELPGAFVLRHHQCDAHLPWQRTGFTSISVAILRDMAQSGEAQTAVLDKIKAWAGDTLISVANGDEITVGAYEVPPDGIEVPINADLRPSANVAKMQFPGCRQWADHSSRLARRTSTAWRTGSQDAVADALHAAVAASDFDGFKIAAAAVAAESSTAQEAETEPEPQTVSVQEPVARTWSSLQKQTPAAASDVVTEIVTVGDTFAVNGEVHFATRELQCVMSLFAQSPTQDHKFSHLLQHLNTTGLACDPAMLNRIIGTTKVKNPSRENRSYAHPVFELLGDQSKDPVVSLHAIALHLLLQIQLLLV